MCGYRTKYYCKQKDCLSVQFYTHKHWNWNKRSCYKAHITDHQSISIVSWNKTLIHLIFLINIISRPIGLYPNWHFHGARDIHPLRSPTRPLDSVFHPWRRLVRVRHLCCRKGTLWTNTCSIVYGPNCCKTLYVHVRHTLYVLRQTILLLS